MSYDLMAFEISKAPKDKKEFLKCMINNQSGKKTTIMMI